MSFIDVHFARVVLEIYRNYYMANMLQILFTFQYFREDKTGGIVMKFREKNGMRKKFAVFGLLCMLLMTTCIGSLTVYAQDDAKIAVSAGDGEQGKTTEVKFNLEGNPGIWGLKFRVGYDHSALKLTSVTNGNVFSDGDVTLPETLDKEQFVYLASANKLENITANGTVVTLSFQVASSLNR